MKTIGNNMTRALSVKLDENSDRYRICPNCKQSYMTSHRGSDFCSPFCHDEFNNRRKKHNHILQKQQNFSAVVEEKNHIETSSIELKHEQQLLEKMQISKATNQKILSDMRIDLDIRRVTITGMHEKGFLFNAFDFRIEYPARKEKYCLIFGSYQIIYGDVNEILIFKKTRPWK